MLYCKHDGYISSNLWLDTNVQASTQWKDFKLVKTTKKVVKNIPLSLPAFCRIVAKLTSDRGFDLLKNCTVKCDYIFIKDLVIDRMVDDYRNRLN